MDNVNLVPRDRVTFVQGTGNEAVPVLLEKGNAGSGNEIGMMWFSRHIF